MRIMEWHKVRKQAILDSKMLTPSVHPEFFRHRVGNFASYEHIGLVSKENYS